MGLSNVVVCSFYTADDYYRSHADRLRKNLDGIGVVGELEEIEKPEGLDWADICRKKVPFLARVCEKHPDKKVFWIDVDCELLDLPELLVDFTADLIGFQRGFSSPLTIGYAQRTRFWEPCLFGVNTTPAARRFVAQAAEIEAASELKATDDYFFEESWRANAATMSFQIIPSAMVTGKGGGQLRPFFTFGSSGNVAEFKGKVVQHTAAVESGRPAGPRKPLALRVVKRAERLVVRVSPGFARRLRRLVDRSGLTHLLTRGAHGQAGTTRHRQAQISHALAAGQRGELVQVREIVARMNATTPPNANEKAAQEAAESFARYAGTGEGEPIPLMWWTRPFPGNFGDWLSPLVVQHVSGRPVRYVPPAASTSEPHLASIGSIGRFIRSSSIVVGTGISSEDVELETSADYVSVRGPITARTLARAGGPNIQSFGDPGALIARILPVERPAATNGRTALVRHFRHAGLPVVLPSTMDELTVYRSSPRDIEELMTELVQYDVVVTSAMHVLIACQSFGIPCALVVFSGHEGAVHGSGIKYRDYSEGVGLDTVVEPVSVPLDLRTITIDDLVTDQKVAEDRLDEIERAVLDGVERFLERTS